MLSEEHRQLQRVRIKEKGEKMNKKYSKYALGFHCEEMKSDFLNHIKRTRVSWSMKDSVNSQDKERGSGGEGMRD